MPEDKVRTWVLHCQWHGIAGLQHKYSRYSERFKREVLAHQDREQLSNRQIATICDIRNGNQVAVWRRKLLSCNDDGAGIEDDSAMTGIRNHRREALAGLGDDEKTKVLVRENERLRSEVACLKKLHALIRARRSVAPTTRIVLGLRRHHKLATLLTVAGLARSTFYYQRQALQGAGQDGHVWQSDGADCAHRSPSSGSC